MGSVFIWVLSHFAQSFMPVIILSEKLLLKSGI